MKKTSLFFGLAISAVMLSCNNEKAVETTDAPASSETVATTTPAEAQKPAVNPLTIISDSTKFGKFEFAENKFDCGTIKQGEKVQHTFKFKNTGTVPLIIADAKTPCGCTVPSYSKEPIPVGGESEIVVAFDSKGKSSKQLKTIRLFGNTIPTETKIIISGTVEAPAKPAAAAEDHSGHNH